LKLLVLLLLLYAYVDNWCAFVVLNVVTIVIVVTVN
jgi:nicotinamide riboside transporter PnuC